LSAPWSPTRATPAACPKGSTGARPQPADRLVSPTAPIAEVPSKGPRPASGGIGGQQCGRRSRPPIALGCTPRAQASRSTVTRPTPWPTGARGGLPDSYRRARAHFHPVAACRPAGSSSRPAPAITRPSPVYQPSCGPRARAGHRTRRTLRCREPGPHTRFRGDSTSPPPIPPPAHPARSFCGDPMPSVLPAVRSRFEHRPAASTGTPRSAQAGPKTGFP
jgi:hypothetical protein